MPDRKRLIVGDRVRLLRVPAGDLEQRDRERRGGVEDAGWTADTLERILALDPVVTITSVDEAGDPWFEYHLWTDGVDHHHTIAIMEDGSWEPA